MLALDLGLDMDMSLRTGRDPGSHTGSCRGNRGVLGRSGAGGEHLLQTSCDTSCKSEVTPPKPGKAPKGYQKG